MTIDAKRLFDMIRRLAGRGLTQSEVDEVNAILAGSPNRRASARGIDLIHSFESYRATTYPDPGPTGLPVTGGWGSTVDEDGRPFRLGSTYSRDYWDRLFVRDLADKEQAVNALLGDAPTTQAQFDAFISLAYNIGTGAFGKSTLLKLHKAGDHAGAAAEFAKWNKAKGEVLPGLTRRRAAEAALYRGQA